MRAPLVLLVFAHLDVLVAQPVPQACCFGDGFVAYGRECYKYFPPAASWDDVQKCWQLGAQHFSNKSSAEQFQIFSIFLGSTTKLKRNTFSTLIDTYDHEIAHITGNGSTLTMDSSVVAANLEPLDPMLPLFIQFVFPTQENSGAQASKRYTDMHIISASQFIISHSPAILV